MFFNQTAKYRMMYTMTIRDCRLLLGLFCLMLLACNEPSDIATFEEETNALSIKTRVSQEDLPANINTYLSTNFPDTEMTEAFRHNNQGTISYSILLVDGIRLLFSPNGILLAIDDDGQDMFEDRDGNEILAANLPPTIIKYIVENFPDTIILFTEKEEDGYEIYLSNGLELHFDEDGNFISAENDNDDDGVGEEQDDDDDGENDDSDDDDDDGNSSDDDDG